MKENNKELNQKNNIKNDIKKRSIKIMRTKIGLKNTEW